MHVSANDNEMTFHSIYVGSGDALVVESKGHYMIVDSGPPSASELVANYISKLNIPDNKIDYVVATILTETMLVTSIKFLRNMKLDRFSIRLALKVTKLIQNSLIA